MPSSRILIASNTLGSSAASVTFSNIPQTYTDLVLKISSRETPASTTTTFFINYNNDSSAIYSDTIISANGTSALSNRNSAGGSTGNEIGVDSAANATANTFGNNEIYIPNYTGSARKVTSGFGVAESNTASGTRFIQATASQYQGTSAITRIDILGANFASGSTFWLYGLKNS